MVQFFDSISHYQKAKEPGEYQFFISDGDKLKIFTEEEQKQVVRDIKDKFKQNDKIVHSSYILSDLAKPWQRKMFLQQYEMANQVNAKFYVFHLKESPELYKQLLELIKTEKLIFKGRKCQFAVELSSKHVNDSKKYLQQIQKYRELGMSAVFDIQHVASSGIFKDKSVKKAHSSTFDIKHPKYDKQHDETIQQIIKFTKKNAKNFDVLHFADQAVQVDMSKDIHTPPFKDGHLFSFNNIFTSIDLLDSLISQFNVFVVEFIDQDRLFRRSVNRYLNDELSINKELIPYYIRILRWHVQFVFDVNTFDLLDSSNFQISNYEALAQQLIEIYRQPIDTKIYMNSSIWKKYCFPHKIAQLLLIVDLTTYFYVNKIQMPWDLRVYPELERFEPQYDVVSRKTAESLIKKLIKHKIIKSSKQVFGSYLRGNTQIGDLDILIDSKDKKRVYTILKKDINNDAQEQKEYSIARFFIDNQLDIQIYFVKTPNPVMELFLTGNKNFNIFMRKRAKTMGFKLTNTSLLKQISPGEYKELKVKSQKDIFKYLEMKVVPPVFRIFLNDTQGYYDL